MDALRSTTRGRSVGLRGTLSDCCVSAGRYELLDWVMENKYTLLPEHAVFPGLVTLTPVGLNYQTQPVAWAGSHNSMSVCV